MGGKAWVQRGERKLESGLSGCMWWMLLGDGSAWARFCKQIKIEIDISIYYFEIKV